MKRLRAFHSNAVWPPAALVVAFVAVYVLLGFGIWLIERATRIQGELFQNREIQNVRMFILGIASTGYAIYRLARFHPGCSRAYSHWLRLSPWTAEKPLPLGPVHLVWQDAVVIAVLEAVAIWHARLDPGLIAAVFGLSYLIGMTILLAFTRRWAPCLILGFLWPTLMLPAAEGLPIAGLIGAIIAVIWWGHRQSLQAFPWDFLKNSDRPPQPALQTQIQINVGASKPSLSQVGWPFSVLSPKVDFPAVALGASVSISALIGWWVYCVIKRAAWESAPEVILFAAALSAFFRFVIYASGKGTPFNIWGRISSGKLIVPGFDRVLLTPIFTVVVAVLGGMMIRRSGDCYPAAEAIVIAVISFVLTAGGPTLRNWTLTGRHRFRPPTRTAGGKQSLRPV